MSFLNDLYEALTSNSTLENVRADRRNRRRADEYTRADMLDLKRREIEALETLAQRGSRSRPA